MWFVSFINYEAYSYNLASIKHPQNIKCMKNRMQLSTLRNWTGATRRCGRIGMKSSTKGSAMRFTKSDIVLRLIRDHYASLFVHTNGENLSS